MFIAFSVAFLLPKILDMFWIIGLLICNFNGLIIPIFLWLQVIREKKEKGMKVK